jgi:hypothetical protein
MLSELEDASITAVVGVHRSLRLRSLSLSVALNSLPLPLWCRRHMEAMENLLQLRLGLGFGRATAAVGVWWALVEEQQVKLKSLLVRAYGS